MVDFAKIRADRQALADIQKNAPYKPPIRDLHKQKLSDLLGDARDSLNSWEHQFCEDVLNKLLKWDHMKLTEKQVAVLNKTWSKFFTANSEAADEEDPTPPGNSPAQFARQEPSKKGLANYNDDIDDDIPF